MDLKSLMQKKSKFNPDGKKHLPVDALRRQVSDTIKEKLLKEAAMRVD